MNVKTPLREVRLRVAACLAVVMFAVDSLNPVKIVCSALNINEAWIGVSALGAFFIITSSNASDLMYFSMKVFFHSLLSIFFSSIEVLGKQNIPPHGPVIFTGNHMNQFVDAAVIMSTNPMKVGFLVAEKSYNKPLIGWFSKAVGSIPVKRPQDLAVKGEGQVKLNGCTLLGDDKTKFTQLEKGDKVRPGNTPDGYSVSRVVSDRELLLVDPGETGAVRPSEEPQDVWMGYEVMKYVDQSAMFKKVQEALASGSCLGIFPEGGSHDRTDLLPLKVGIASIAFGVLEHHGVSVPIVPVGLNYYRGHRFRGRVVIEFGAPMRISEHMLDTFKKSKRAGYQELLLSIEESMRSVLVTAPDYNTLKGLHIARRLYQKPATSHSTKQKQDLARRFSVGYELLCRKYGTLPDDIQQMHAKLEEYQDTLDEWGLRDYQVNNLDAPFSTLLNTFLHLLVVCVLASIPSLLLNAPVGFAASMWANVEAKKDLKNSRVKLAARDVLLSKKILFSMVAVPVLWVFYMLLLVCFTNLSSKVISLIFVCLPLFSYFGVMAVQAGMVDLKDLRPSFLRLLPSFHEAVAVKLPARRLLLQQEVTALVRKYGPEVGEVYTSRELSWEKVMRDVMTNSDDVDDENDHHDVKGGGGGDGMFSALPTMHVVDEDIKKNN